jgi:hypothetical protein
MRSQRKGWYSPEGYWQQQGSRPIDNDDPAEADHLIGWASRGLYKSFQGYSLDCGQTRKQGHKLQWLKVRLRFTVPPEKKVRHVDVTLWGDPQCYDSIFDKGVLHVYSQKTAAKLDLALAQAREAVLEERRL